jgi:hypothetical protein
MTMFAGVGPKVMGTALAVIDSFDSEENIPTIGSSRHNIPNPYLFHQNTSKNTSYYLSHDMSLFVKWFQVIQYLAGRSGW